MAPGPASFLCHTTVSPPSPLFRASLTTSTPAPPVGDTSRRVNPLRRRTRPFDCPRSCDFKAPFAGCDARKLEGHGAGKFKDEEYVGNFDEFENRET